jgi:hypothetical protein
MIKIPFQPDKICHRGDVSVKPARALADRVADPGRNTQRVLGIALALFHWKSLQVGYKERGRGRTKESVHGRPTGPRS